MQTSSKIKSSRLISFDIMRGLLLVIIIIDHMQRFPGLYEYLTGRGHLWSSAAEAFFILSGIMAGFVYVRRNQAKPFTTTWKKIWRRAAILYAWSIGLTLLYTGFAYLLGQPASIKPGLAVDINLVKLLTDTLTFHYIYGWADFLAYYAIFLAAAPLIAWLLRLKLGWLAAILSLIVWMQSGTNFILTWQILFYFGMIVGYYLPEIQSKISQLSPGQRRAAGTTIVITAVGVWLWSSVVITLRSIMESRAIYNFGSLSLTSIYDHDSVLGRYFDKTSLPTLRLLVSGLWFSGILILLRERKTEFFFAMKSFLAPLGRNSLFVYILHSFLLFWLDYFLPRTTNRLYNVLVVTVMLAVVWYATKALEHYHHNRRPDPAMSIAAPDSQTI